MAAGTIRLPTEGSGPYTQTFNNTISAVSVHATGVHLVTSAGISTDPPSGTGVSVCGNVNSGSADSGSPVKVAGKYNATAPSLSDGQRGDLQLDSAANLKVTAQRLDSTKLTFYSSFRGTLAAALTDVLEIRGSASKTVRIREITYSAYEAAVNLAVTVMLTKRSANNTGGTSASQTIVPADSADTSATCSILGYSAAPGVLGSSVGVIAHRVYELVPISSSGNLAMNVLTWKFGDSGEKPIVLRGTSECLCVGFTGGPTFTSAPTCISVVLTEE